jgi:hypothetical protein
MLTVLSLIREALTAQVEAVATGVRVLPIAGDGDLPSDVRGEILLTYLGFSTAACAGST